MESSNRPQKTSVGVSNKSISWTNDGVDGKRSSMEILLDWITVPSNFDKYKGGVSLDGIVRLMKLEGIHHRNASDIQSKIEKLEASYVSIIDNGDRIRQIDSKNGVASEATERKIKELIHKICPYYDRLDPVLKNKPSIVPPFPNVSGDDTNVMEIMFGSRNGDYDVEDVLPAGTPASSSSSGTRRPLVSFATGSTDQRPSKKTKLSVENALAELLKSSVKAQNDRLALDRERLEMEREQLVKEQQQKMELFEGEKRLHEVRKMQLQLELTKVWQSLGKTTEEIDKLLTETLK